MNGVSNRSARKIIDEQGEQLWNHHEVLQALVHDQKTTRARLDALEAFRDLTFLDRLIWLWKGYRG